jgi:uracil-DNA glycosylase
VAATDATWSQPTASAADAASAAPTGGTGADQLTRKTELAALAAEASGCTRCRLAEGRTQVVFGVGDPDADLVFVGEAPGFHEDQQGYPFVGAAGKLLDKLLGGIGMSRQDVYIANVLKCRPPGNRDPMPDEIEACETYLFRQLSLIQPKLVATLGNFATKLLSGKQHGITRVHGQPQPAQVGGLPVVLYPLYHPAAALYTPAMLRTLEEDFARIPQLLAGSAAPEVAVPEALDLDADVIPFPEAAREPISAGATPTEQLELF